MDRVTIFELNLLRLNHINTELFENPYLILPGSSADFPASFGRFLVPENSFEKKKKKTFSLFT